MPKSKKNSEPTRIGIINEIIGYQAKIIINKDEAPEPVYPLRSPMPIHILDENENVFLIYEQNLISPAGDLPSLNIISDSGVITLDPAKQFILESALSNFQGLAVLVTESGIPQPMSYVNKISDKNLPQIWKQYGFNHLKHVESIINGEKFKIFMRVYSELFREMIVQDNNLRKSLLKTLVEIGSASGLNNSEDYLKILHDFTSESSTALVLENRKSSVNIYLKSKQIKYGNLICFKDDHRSTLVVIKDINLTAETEPIYEINEGTPTTFVSALEMGMEGSSEGVEEIIEELFNRLKGNFIKIPVGKIPGLNKSYEIALKGNELIHFAIIAISGSGKGNLLKQFIFKTLEQMVLHEKEHGNLTNYNGQSMIIFDDVGEYVKSLKPYEWGANIGSFILKYVYDKAPRIHFIDITLRTEMGDPLPEGYEFLETIPKKIPLQYIPVIEIIGSLEGKVAIGVIPAYLRDFYRQDEYKPLRPDFIESRLTVEFVNWFFEQDNQSNFSDNNRDSHGYIKSSYDAAKRALLNFLISNKQYLGLKFDWENETFSLFNSIKEDITENDNVIGQKIIENFDLVKLAEKCASKGEILIIDESSLSPNVKLLIQRILLNHIVKKREEQGFNPKIRPCLFIIEEATALMRGKESKQLQLFNEVQVKARKFGIGIGLILQDIQNLDPTLLTQLGWLIAMGLPVNGMRQLLFRNVPADLGPYDDFVKRADIGIAVGFQKLIGKNLPLPIKIDHYEKAVKEKLQNDENWEGVGFDEDMQNDFKTISSEIGIPEDVINELIKKEEGN